MRIIGHGIDLVDTRRIERLLEEHGERFLSRCYTTDELAYIDSNSKRRLEHLAGRFAAKEAILKVLGTGWRGGIAWTDAELVRLPSGRPEVRLHGICEQLAGKQGIVDWHVSISHIETHAMASAIALADE